MKKAPDRTAAAAATDAHLENFVSFRVSRLSHLLARGAEALYGREFGLSIRQWRVLATLGRFPGMSVVAIAARTALDKSQVSRAVGELKQRRLVEQRPADDDQRRSVLTLTAEGRGLYERVLPIARQRQQRLVAALTPRDLAVLDAALETLTRTATKMLKGDGGGNPR